MELTRLQYKIIRKNISLVLAGAAVLITLNIFVPNLLVLLAQNYFPQVLIDTSMYLLYMYIPICAINFPIAYLVIRASAPPMPIPKNKMSFVRLLCLFAVTYFIAYVGSIIGNLVSIPFSISPIFDFIEAISEANIGVRILIICVLVPLMEELLFRKWMIDRLNRYGMWLAVLLSSIAFSLYHGNFTQFFFSFGIGIIFGYIYIKTGNVLYTWGLHFVVNFISSIIASSLIFDMFDAADGFAPLMRTFFFVLVMLGIALFGLVYFILHRKEFDFTPRIRILPQKGWAKTAFLNVGMVLMAAAGVVSTILSYI